jgi:iron complex outermembrane recepter protein
MWNYLPSSDAGRQEESPVTPKVGVSFQATDNHLFYASYAEGYRIGGVNQFIPYAPCAEGFDQLGLSESPTTYDSDTTESFEVGAKNNLLGGRIRLASSVYFIKWNDIQTAVVVPLCGYRYIANQGQAESKGFDLQAQAELFAGLTIDLALGYSDAQFTKQFDFGTNNPAVLDGTAIGGPEWTLALGAQYDFDAFGRQSFVRVDWQHAAEQDGLTATQDPRIARTYDPDIPIPPATDYVTMRAGTKLNQVDLAVFVDNLLNSSETLLRAHPNRAAPDYTFTTWRPRTVSLIAGWRF